MTTRNGEWGWPEIEELLQCPVCLDKPNPGTNVEQCKNGHHVCSACRYQLAHCPICKSHFYGTRNFVVEEMINNYEILKNIMMLNNIVKEAKMKKRKRKQKELLESIIKVDINRCPIVDVPRLTKGEYPCRVRNCIVILPLSRMLNHVRSCHQQNVQEVAGENGSFSTNFEISYHTSNLIQFHSHIFSVRGIGLVFVNIEILSTGELIVFCQMAAKGRVAQKSVVCLSFGPAPGVYMHSVTQRLVSLRDNPDGMMQRRYCGVILRNQAKQIWRNRKGHCQLKISPCRTFDPMNLADPDEVQLFAGIRASLMDQLIIEESLKKFEGFLKSGAVRKNTSCLQQTTALAAGPSHVNGTVKSLGAAKTVVNAPPAQPAPNAAQVTKSQKKRVRRKKRNQNQTNARN